MREQTVTELPERERPRFQSWDDSDLVLSRVLF